MRGSRPERLASFEPVAEELNGLAAAARNVFGTYEWLTTWSPHFGDGDAFSAAACRGDDGTLFALLPLYLWKRRPARVARFLGHGVAGELGPVCAPEDRFRTARALEETLEELGVDLFLGEGLPARDQWPQALGASALRTIPCPVLSLAGATWDEYLASRSAKLRQALRYEERRLRRDHTLGFRAAHEAERIDAELDLLFSLHGARWGGEATEFTAGGREHVHRQFAALAHERGWLRLWLLEVDGRPVAAWYGFRFGNVESFYQLGRDPAWHRSSVGLLLVAHTIREAIADGVDEYRFGPGGDRYKYRFTGDDPGLVTLALGRSLAGRLALAGAQAFGQSAALRRALRPLLHR